MDAEHGLRFTDRFLVDAVEAGLEALEWLFWVDQEGCGLFDLLPLCTWAMPIWQMLARVRFAVSTSMALNVRLPFGFPPGFPGS